MPTFRLKPWREGLQETIADPKKGLDVPANSHRNNQWTTAQKNLVRGNLREGWHIATPEQKTLGAQFFPTWNQDAVYLGEHLRESGLTDRSVGTKADPLSVGATLLSHLSPKNESEKNRVQAYELTHHLMTRGTADFDRHLRPMQEALGKRNEVKAYLDKGLKNQSITRGSAEHVRLQSLMVQHQTVVDQHRLAMGMAFHVADEHGGERVMGSPLTGVGTREIMNAIEGIKSADPLSTLGGMKKEDFGRSIHDPEGYPRGTIDTHMYDLAMGVTHLAYEAPRGLSAKGRYNTVSGLLTEAHKQVKPGVPISEFMAGEWVGHQFRKLETNEDARSARKAAGTSIERMLNTTEFTPYLPQTHGQPDVYNKFPGL